MDVEKIIFGDGNWYKWFK